VNLVRVQIIYDAYVQDPEYGSKLGVKTVSYSEPSLSAAKTIHLPFVELRRPSAAILYKRGVLSKPCEACKKAGTFQHCITAPEYGPRDEERAFFSGSCSNCLWNAKGAKCDCYLGRHGFWNPEDDEQVPSLTNIPQ
jgi:hypothetical protein